VSDLNEHFQVNKTLVEDLMKDVEAICNQYLSASAADNAMFPNPSLAAFPEGDTWDCPIPTDPSKSAPDKVFNGDQVLANTCCHMKNSMLHYEFQSSISDGDIGRAMNVMAVRILYLT